MKPGVIVVVAGALMSGGVCADDGVPGILQFAGEYQKKQNAAPAGGTGKVPSAGAVQASSDAEPQNHSRLPSASDRGLKEANRKQALQLRKQADELRQLKRELASLKGASRPGAQPAPAASSLQSWVSGIRQAWKGTPDMARAEDAVRQAKQAAAQAQKKEAEAARRVSVLEERLSVLARQQEHQTNTRREQNNALSEQFAKEKAGLEQQIVSLQKEVQDARDKLREAGASGGEIITLRNRLDEETHKNEQLSGENEKQNAALSGQYKKERAELEQQIANLRAETEASQAKLKNAELSSAKTIADLKDKLAGLTSQNEVMAASAKQESSALVEGFKKERDDFEQQLAVLRRQLEEEQTQNGLKVSSSGREIASLREQLAEAGRQREQLVSTAEQEKASLTQQAGKERSVLEQKLAELQKQRDEQSAAVKESLAEITALRAGSEGITSAELGGDEQARLSYAAGSALGADIADMVDERKSWGVSIADKALQAGVMDAVRGQLQLPRDDLKTLINRADDEAESAREHAISRREELDKAWVQTFSKEKGVMQAPSGFWYRTDEAGDEAIPSDAVVDLVVKETLTDGTVIQDMSVNGKILSQKLENYPPLFREAIGLMKNHGVLTMAVPPAMAYGDEGYPPKILPKSTMVYELRIRSVRPQK